MPEQYVATDKRTGVEVQVTGEFPPHPDDRVRIARTTTLFTRLISTLLDSGEADRRTGFRAVETQLELADALIRQNMDDVRRLVRQTMESMGVTEGQLEELARQLQDLSGMEEATAEQIARALGLERRDPEAQTDSTDWEQDDRLVPDDSLGEQKTSTDFEIGTDGHKGNFSNDTSDEEDDSREEKDDSNDRAPSK